MAKIDKRKLILTGRGRQKRWRKRDTGRTALLAGAGGLLGYEGRQYYLEKKKYESARIINRNKSKIGKVVNQLDRLRKSTKGPRRKDIDKRASDILKKLDEFARLNAESDEAAKRLAKASTTKMTARNVGIAGAVLGAGLGVGMYAARKVDQDKYHDINNKNLKERSFASEVINMIKEMD